MSCPVNFDTVKRGIQVKVNQMIDNGISITEINSQFGEEIVKLKDTPQSNKDLTSLLSDLHENGTDLEKKEDIQYFIDKAREDSAAFMDRFGKKLTTELLNESPLEKLIENRDYVIEKFGVSESTDYLNTIIKNRTYSIIPSDELVNTYLANMDNVTPKSDLLYKGEELTEEDLWYTSPDKMSKEKANTVFNSLSNKYNKFLSDNEQERINDPEFDKYGFMEINEMYGNRLEEFRAEEEFSQNKFDNEEDFTQNKLDYEDDSDIIFQMSSYIDKADKELDNRLISFLKPLGITVEMLDTLKERTGVDAVGAADIINKIILINKNKASLDTLPEETAHFFIEFLGNQNVTVKTMMSKITQWSGYQAVYNEYKDIYNNNENRIKKEAIGKLIGQYIVGNRKASLTLLEEIMKFIKEALARFDINLIEVEDLAEDIAADILSKNYSKLRQKMPSGSRVVDYAETMKQNPEFKKVSDKLRELGFYLAGSVALRQQGILYRSADEKAHDLDFRVPNTLKDTWKEAIEKEFGIIQSERSFSRSNEDIHSISINGIGVDLFIKKDTIPEADSENITKWQDVMGAKLGLDEGLFGTFGRTKDIVDYMTFTPNEKSDGFDNPNHVYYSLGTENADDAWAPVDKEENKKRKLRTNPVSFLLNSEQLSIFKRLQNAGLISKKAWFFNKNNKEYFAYTVPKIPQYAATSTLYSKKENVEYVKDYAKQNALDEFILRNNINFMRTIETPNAILIKFGNFESDNIYKSNDSITKVTPAGTLTKQKVLNFLSKIGFTNIEKVKTLIHNGVEIEGLAYVDFANKIMQIVEGNEDVTLPEEAMHILVELVKLNDPILYRSMEKEVVDYQLYRNLINDDQYLKDINYRVGKTLSGALDYNKLKDEVIAKLLAEFLIGDTEEGIGNRDKIKKINNWWKNLITWIRNLFGKYKNPFKQALAKMEDEEDSSLFADIKSDEIFFAKGFKSLEDRDKEYEYTKSTFLNMRDKSSNDGFTKVEDIYYKNGEKWVGKRVTDFSTEFYSGLFKGRPLDEEKRAEYDALAQDGKYIHAIFEDAFRSLVDKETGLLRVTPDNLTGGLYQTQLERAIAVKVLKFMREYLSLYPEGTRFLSETIVYDQTKNIIGTIDFLAITPDKTNSTIDKVDIIDWKTKKTLEEVQDYKKMGWEIQLNAYKTVLTNAYNIKKTQIGKLRATPIERVYTRTGTLKNVLIGDINPAEEEERRLRPVISSKETTGNPVRDNLITSLQDTYKTFVQQLKDRKIPNREILNNIENAIYELRVSNEINHLTLYLNLLLSKITQIRIAGDTEKSTDPSVIKLHLSQFNLYRDIYDKLKGINKLIIGDEKISRVQRDDLRKVNDKIDLVMEIMNETNVKLLNIIGEQNSVYDLIAPEKVVKGLSYYFRAMGDHDVSTIQLMNELTKKSYNRIDIETDIELKNLKELEYKFEQFIKTSGLSKQDAIKKLVNIEKGGLHSKIDQSFYEERSKVFASKDIKKIIAFVNTNFDIEKWKEWYKKDLAEQQNMWNSANFSEDPKENIRIRKYVEQQYDLNNNILKNPLTAFNKFNRLVWSKNIKEELWLSPEYKEIESNPVLSEIYNFFINKNKQLVDIGALPEWKTYVFLPSIRRGISDIFSINDKNIFEKVGDAIGQSYTNVKNKISVDDYQLNFLGDIDEVTGEKTGKRFIPFIKDLDKNWELYKEASISLGIITKEDKGKVASEKIKLWRESSKTNNDKFVDKILSLRQKSFDIFRVYGYMVKEIAKEKYLQENDEIIKALEHLEENKPNFATNAFGNVAMKGGEPQISKIAGQNAELFKKYRKYIVNGEQIQIDSDYAVKFSLKKIWNKTPLAKLIKFDIEDSDKSGISVTKFAMWLNNFNTLKTLGLNAGSAISNLFGNAFGADKLYSKKISTTDLMEAWGKMTSGAFYATEDMKKRAALVDYFLPLLNNREIYKADQLSVNEATKILSQDWLMWPQRRGDEVVQLNIFLAHIENTGLIDGKLVNVRELADKETKSADYWRKSPQERKEMDKKFEERLKELKEKYSVVKLSTFKTIKEAGKDKIVIEIPGIERTSNDVAEIRASVQTMSKDATGSADEFDMATYRFAVLGRLGGTFKNWIPRMADVRWAEFHYSKSHNSYEYGRFRMWARALSSNWLASISKIIPLPYITGKVTKNWGKEDLVTRALELYAEKKREVEILGKDLESIMSEKEFVDKFIRGTEASFAEARVFTLMMLFLIFAIMKPDDDDDWETKSLKKKIRNQVDKMSNEVGFFFDPVSAINIAASPFPITGFVKDIYSLSTNTFKQTLGFTLEELGEEEAGKRMQDRAKPMKYFFKVLPVLKEILFYAPAFDQQMAKDWGIQINDNKPF